jgi:rhamnogalacturonyl hydrolase YesR
MAKLSKRAKEALSHALDGIMRMAIIPLFSWTADENDAFFFIIIGNKMMTDVAWSNTDGLALNGALTVANDPEAASAFEFIKTTYDLAIVENCKDDGFKERFTNQIDTSEIDSGWISTESL